MSCKSACLYVRMYACQPVCSSVSLCVCMKSWWKYYQVHAGKKTCWSPVISWYLLLISIYRGLTLGVSVIFKTHSLAHPTLGSWYWVTNASRQVNRKPAVHPQMQVLTQVSWMMYPSFIIEPGRIKVPSEFLVPMKFEDEYHLYLDLNCPLFWD